MLRPAIEASALVCAAIVFAVVTSEGLARVGLRFGRGQPFASETYRAAMTERVHDAEKPAPKVGPGEYSIGLHEVLHPYLGFVPDPAVLADHTTIGDPGQILERSDRSRIVAVFGGSFAAGVCAFGGAELRRVLALPGKDVRLLCLGAGGYKQPQQLLALTYLLAQGAHFDIVINVNGFNEVALPPIENLRQGVAPQYPRSWFWRVGNVVDPDALKLLAELSIVERTRSEWGEAFVQRGLYRSALLALMWEAREARLAAVHSRLSEEIQGQKVIQRKSYASTGPLMNFKDETSLSDYLARIWKASSLQMKALCEANGTLYFHFLQPNQYVVASKPIAPEEARFFAGPSPYQKAVVEGYPVLRQRGEELRKVGVAFHDLTMVFKDRREPLYNDGCCHVNPSGYIMIARAVGEAISGNAR